MNKLMMRCAVLAGLACCSVCWGQDKGSWRAESKTASAITGDIGISADKVFLNFNGYTISQIRALKPDELSALFAAEGETDGAGFLYRVNIPGEKKFLHKNNLCGSEDVTYMATSAHGKSLRLALFSGLKMPVLTIDAINATTDLCGTFGYAR